MNGVHFEAQIGSAFKKNIFEVNSHTTQLSFNSVSPFCCEKSNFRIWERKVKKDQLTLMLIKCWDLGASLMCLV